MIIPISYSIIASVKSSAEIRQAQIYDVRCPSMGSDSQLQRHIPHLHKLTRNRTVCSICGKLFFILQTPLFVWIISLFVMH